MLYLFHLTNQLSYGHFTYIVGFLNPINGFYNLRVEKIDNKGYQYYRIYPYYFANLAIYSVYSKPSIASLIIIFDNFVGHNFSGRIRCYYRNDSRVGLIGKLTLWNFHGVKNGNVNINENPIYPTNKRVY